MDTRQTVMDIAMNLSRIGNWVADDYKGNFFKIKTFFVSTDGYISNMKVINEKFKDTWLGFMKVYPNMKRDPLNNAENLMTWGNILTHRSKLI